MRRASCRTVGGVAYNSRGGMDGGDNELVT